MMSIVIVGTIKLTMNIIKTQNKNFNSSVFILFLSIIANISIAMYLPIFNKCMYLGQWSPNYWHSPTYTLLKPLALFSFFSMYNILFIEKSPKIYHYILTSFLLFYGTLVKPNFIICYIPFLFLMLIITRKSLTDYFKTFLIISPCIILLFLQFYFSISSF